MTITLPTFGRFLDALNAAGIETRSARGFWGGVAADDNIVVTFWSNQGEGNGRWPIWRPKTRHGNLRDAWDVGRIEPGANVRAVMLRQGKNKGSVHSAGLMPGWWRVVERTADNKAVIEPVP